MLLDKPAMSEERTSRSKQCRQKKLVRKVIFIKFCKDMVQYVLKLYCGPPGISPSSEWTNLWTVELDWTGVFQSYSTMVYEVTIGNQPGVLFKIDDVIKIFHYPLRNIKIQYISVSNFTSLCITGTTPGGIDVLPWTESTESSMRISGVDSSRVQYITVTAINKAGLYTAIRFSTSFGNK